MFVESQGDLRPEEVVRIVKFVQVWVRHHEIEKNAFCTNWNVSIQNHA